MATSDNQKLFTTSRMALTALMTAIICILGPIALPIPVSPVPISLQNMLVFFSVAILGWKLGTVSYILYLLLGLVGLPVFSGYSAGAGKLFGPTGGYLLGFIVMAIIGGICFEKFENKLVLILGLIVSAIICNLIGTLWLAQQAGLTFNQALMAGVVPYIPGDLVKIILAAIFGPMLKKRIKMAGLEI